LTFDSITGGSASTASTVGGLGYMKIYDWLTGGATSQIASILDSDLFLHDTADATKRARFDAGNITTSTDRVFTFPDKDLTISSVIGTQELWVPAGAMKPRATSGAALTDRTQATSNYEQSTMNFDTATDEYVQLPPIALPANYNNGTIRVMAYWSCTGGGSAQTIALSATAYAYSDNDALTTAFSGTQTITDTWIADNDLHVSAYCSALTIGGTPADNDLIIIELMRDVSADDLAVDLELIGVKIELTLDDGTSS